MLVCAFLCDQLRKAHRLEISTRNTRRSVSIYDLDLDTSAVALSRSHLIFLGTQQERNRATGFRNRFGQRVVDHHRFELGRKSAIFFHHGRDFFFSLSLGSCAGLLQLGL